MIICEVTILGGSGGMFPGKNKLWVSETAFPDLWRYLENNVNVLINHLLIVSNSDFRIFDNLLQWET